MIVTLSRFTRKGPPIAPKLPGGEALIDDREGIEAALAILDAQARYATDVWAWIAECVTTVDELDPSTPIKPFPSQVCPEHAQYAGGIAVQHCPMCAGPMAPLTYLRELARQWQSATPPLQIIVKARRMRLSWLYIALHTWLALQRSHANCFIVSEKEEKSGELIERARGILARLPSAGGGDMRMEHRSSPPSIRLENGSLLMGVAEGASQLRQYTSTAVMCDEFGFWMNPRETFSALRPTIDGGGRITIVSSAYPGFLKELVAGEALG